MSIFRLLRRTSLFFALDLRVACLRPFRFGMITFLFVLDRRSTISARRRWCLRGGGEAAPAAGLGVAAPAAWRRGGFVAPGVDPLRRSPASAIGQQICEYSRSGPFRDQSRHEGVCEVGLETVPPSQECDFLTNRARG